MLDGLDNFWRARMWDELSKLTPGERAKALPYILKWAEAGARLSGVDVIRGFNATMAIRAAAAKLFGELDYVVSPVSPVVNFAAELAAPLNDPEKPFEHIAYTVPWNMSENPAVSINGGFEKKGFPDRRADRRPPLRRHRRARHGQDVRGIARAAEAWPRAAEEITRSVIPGRAKREPEIHLSQYPHGFRVCAFGASRNDSQKSKKQQPEETTRCPMRPSNTRSRNKFSPSR